MVTNNPLERKSTETNSPETEETVRAKYNRITDLMNQQETLLIEIIRSRGTEEEKDTRARVSPLLRKLTQDSEKAMEEWKNARKALYPNL